MKNLKMNKKVVATILSFTLATTAFVGCNKKEYKPTLIEYEQLIDNFDLLKDKDYLIINTVNYNGKEETKFAHRISLSDIYTNEYQDINTNRADYDKYFITEIEPRNTYLYFDIDGNLLSIKYIYTNKSILKDNITEENYKISTITSEEPAYNYAVSYIGSRDNYSRDEIIELEKKLEKDKKSKVYKKSK